MSAVISELGHSLPAYNPYAGWSLPQLYDFKQVLEKLDALDKRLGLFDCADKDGKYIKQLQRRIATLEKKVAASKRAR